MILETLIHDNRHVASYASVCRDWQAVVEKKTLRRLKLRAPCLDEFDRIFKDMFRRRRNVRHIWLSIDLQPYTCRICRFKESASWVKGNNLIFKRAIIKFLGSLKDWEQYNGGLALELSVQSPSDSQHWFKNCCFGDSDWYEDGAVPEPGDQLQEAGTAEFDDPRHGWVDGEQVRFPNVDTLLRFHQTLRLNTSREYPAASAVTSFFLRRQCRRWLSPTTLGRLLYHLPEIRRLVYEPWQAWGTKRQSCDKGKRAIHIHKEQ